MSATAGRRLVLWRHGRTASNAAGRFQGQLDVPLDDVGRAQARAAAPCLARLRPTALVTSDLARAADTAAELVALTGLQAVPDTRLRELYAADWEGLLHPQIRARWPAEHAAWIAGEDIPVGGGERRSDVGVRVAQAITEHVERLPPEATLVVASHSGALRAGILALLDLPATAWPRLGSLGNGHWALLVDRGGGWSLRGYDLASPDSPPDGPPGESSPDASLAGEAPQSALAAEPAIV